MNAVDETRAKARACVVRKLDKHCSHWRDAVGAEPSALVARRRQNRDDGVATHPVCAQSQNCVYQNGSKAYRSRSARRMAERNGSSNRKGSWTIFFFSKK